jgi:3-methyladenine DNA glycosylase Tag
MASSFKTIYARAAKRKGGEAALRKLLPPKPDNKKLARLTDARVLSEMAKRIFSAGFVWSVIENKWDGFEAAFLKFEPRKLLHKPDEFWEKLASDKRIVRNPQKIRSVRANAQFVLDIAAEHGSFGKFLASWPADDQVGLLDLLAKRGSRLGGHTGQYLIRFLGRDSWIASRDVILCLRDAGVDIAENPTSKRDLQKIQNQFNIWAKESGLPLVHISRICAMSIGENYDAETLKHMMGGEED